MTKISLEEVKNKKDILLISPTASSDEFSGIDDNFLRLQVAKNSSMFDTLSKYLLKKSLLKIAVIYDVDNFAYSNSFSSNFEKSLLKTVNHGFVSKIKINQPYENILKLIKKKDSNVLLIIANSMDSSKLIQYLKINKINKKIICSGWAKTNDFISNGGKAVENVIFFTSYDDSSKNKAYLDFIKKYKQRYSKEPSVFAAQGYETVQILIKVLLKNPDISKLKDSIIKERTFEALQGDIIFDKFGDVKRDNFLITVKNSKFVRLK